jgi:LPXTG-motif cell wall-anchored protein
MTKKSLIKTLLGVSVLAIGAGSFAVANAKPATMAEAANVTVAAGSAFYAFVPDSWIASSRFLTIKFTGSGTPTTSGATGLKTEAFSVNSDTSVSHITSGYAGCDVYQLTLVSGFTHLFYCQVPSIPSGYSSFTWSRAQVLTYPSTVTTAMDWGSSSYKKWDGATTISTLTGNLISVNPDAPISAPVAATYSGTRAFVSDTEKVNEWAYKVLKTYSTVCASGKTHAQNDQTGASLYFQQGWTYQTQSMGDAADWNALTSKALFTNVTASTTSSLYYARFASMYDYILSKYGYYSTTNTTAYLANYANRTIPSFVSGSSIVDPATTDSSSTLVLGGIAAVAALASGAYFFVRKKKSA